MINFKISLCHACFCLFIYLFFPLLYVVTHWSGILQKADKWSTYYLLSCIATHTGTTLETFWFCKRLCCSTTQVALVFLFLHALASVAAIVFCEHHLTQAFCLIALLSLCFLFFFLPSISADPSISVLFCSEPRFAFALIIFSVIVIITVLLMCPSRVSNCISGKHLPADRAWIWAKHLIFNHFNINI